MSTPWERGVRTVGVDRSPPRFLGQDGVHLRPVGVRVGLVHDWPRRATAIPGVRRSRSGGLRIALPVGALRLGEAAEAEVQRGVVHLRFERLRIELDGVSDEGGVVDAPELEPIRPIVL